MIAQLLIYFGSLAILFFFVSLLTKPKFLYITVPLNMIFLGMLLFSYVQFLGTALPFQYDIPFWKFQDFNNTTIVRVKAIAVDEQLIHFLVKNPKDDRVKYITLTNTPELVAKVMKAIKERNGFDMDMALDTHYPGGSGSNFPADTNLQQNHGPSEEKFQTEEGIEFHAATNKGQDNKDGSNNYVP